MSFTDYARSLLNKSYTVLSALIMLAVGLLIPTLSPASSNTLRIGNVYTDRVTSIGGVAYAETTITNIPPKNPPGGAGCSGSAGGSCSSGGSGSCSSC
jgi:hypothetical protein